MSYLNKIILEFTKEKIVAYQYDTMILVPGGGKFNTLGGLIDAYTKREKDRNRRHKKKVAMVMLSAVVLQPEAEKALLENNNVVSWAIESLTS
jgi:NACalpha-BTF3-like transcription factor